MPNKDLAFLYRFQRWRRLRTVAINTQRRNTSVLSRVIQRPPNFVFCSRVGRAAIGHLQTRTKRAAEARPKDTNYEIKSRWVRDRSLIVRRLVEGCDIPKNRDIEAIAQDPPIQFLRSPFSSTRRWKLDWDVLTGTLYSAAIERIARIARCRSLWTSPVEEMKTRIVFIRRCPANSVGYHGHYFREFARALESPCRIFL